MNRQAGLLPSARVAIGEFSPLFSTPVAVATLSQGQPVFIWQIAGQGIRSNNRARYLMQEKLLRSCNWLRLVRKIGVQMLPKKIERVGGRTRIELLGNELGLLLRGLLIHFHATVNDRQIVVCRQIV